MNNYVLNYKTKQLSFLETQFKASMPDEDIIRIARSLCYYRRMTLICIKKEDEIIFENDKKLN